MFNIARTFFDKKQYQQAMIFFPFAILGASLLYLESTGRHLPAK